MISRPFTLHALGLCVSTLACDARGVDVGSEEPCVPDPRFALAESQVSGERPSPCAQIGDNRLLNGDFEAPVIAACNAGQYCQFPESGVAGWNTTGRAGLIELWADGFRGVAAQAGAQFLELDAKSQDTVWQEVALPPGKLMYWSLLHRGRNGIDTMELLLGPANAPTSQRIFSSDADAWYPYSGLYRVGPLETTTRFALVSLSGVDIGNFVDAAVLAPVD